MRARLAASPNCARVLSGQWAEIGIAVGKERERRSGADGVVRVYRQIQAKHCASTTSHARQRGSLSSRDRRWPCLSDASPHAAYRGGTCVRASARALRWEKNLPGALTLTHNHDAAGTTRRRGGRPARRIERRELRWEGSERGTTRSVVVVVALLLGTEIPISPAHESDGRARASRRLHGHGCVMCFAFRFFFLSRAAQRGRTSRRHIQPRRRVGHGASGAASRRVVLSQAGQAGSHGARTHIDRAPFATRTRNSGDERGAVNRRATRPGMVCPSFGCCRSRIRRVIRGGLLADEQPLSPQAHNR